MKTKVSFYLILFLSFFSINSTSQSKPTFENFKGNVYKVPVRDASKVYGKHVYDYRKIGSIDWTEINVSDRMDNMPFPDVNDTKLFCLVLNSTITIHEKSAYEFILNSDDGSKFWIKNKLVVDNGGNHKMTEKRDTIILEKGSYPVKVWYKQIYPDKYGFIFTANNIGLENAGTKVFDIFKEEVTKKERKKINFKSHILFNTNEYLIKENAKLEVDSICKIILENNPSRILIVGHTDDVGGADYNDRLSNKRAEALKIELMNRIKKTGIGFISKGMGERFPIAPNSTEQGRLKNRRVEIILEYHQENIN